MKRECPICNKKTLTTEVKVYHCGMVVFTGLTFSKAEKYCIEYNSLPSTIVTVTLCNSCGYQKTHNTKAIDQYGNVSK
jgi:hypothetical protein